MSSFGLHTINVIIRVTKIVQEDFMRVVKQAKASVSKKELEKFEEWTAEFGEDGT